MKPPRLTDSVPRGQTQASASLRVGLLSKISRADLAAFILREIHIGNFYATTNLCEGRTPHMIPKHKGMSLRSRNDVPMSGLSICRERVDRNDFRRYISKEAC